jgi:dTDP-4-dehydrorhamnose reductase
MGVEPWGDAGASSPECASSRGAQGGEALGAWSTLAAVTIASTLLTGMHGTVAPILAAELRSRGGETLAWDRSAVDPEDSRAIADFIRSSRASALVHCGMGSPLWAERMAACCADLGIPFLYTSSVSVFGSHQVGPFDPDAVPEPTDDYGRYKFECERRVRAAHTEAAVVRLGWQIALRTGGNQMVDHLARQHAEKGHIDASTQWYQACSFLDDTARVLADLLEGGATGLYHLDGNPGWSFHQIVGELNATMDAKWCVRPTADIKVNNLMRDRRLPPASIGARLPGLLGASEP